MSGRNPEQPVQQRPKSPAEVDEALEQSLEAEFQRRELERQNDAFESILGTWPPRTP